MKWAPVTNKQKYCERMKKYFFGCRENENVKKTLLFRISDLFHWKVANKRDRRSFKDYLEDKLGFYSWILISNRLNFRAISRQLLIINYKFSRRCHVIHPRIRLNFHCGKSNLNSLYFFSSLIKFMSVGKVSQRLHVA